jgi:hypothetical protein
VKAPVYKAPPPVVFSWTGCYVGGNVSELVRWGWRSGSVVVFGGAFILAVFLDLIVMPHPPYLHSARRPKVSHSGVAQERNTL